MERFSLYLHVPFCRHRCSYCDFNTFAGMERWIPAYVEAICQEIRLVGTAGADQSGAPIPAHTVFFGGGTPSLLSAEQIARILAEIGQRFDLLPGAEITMEANPGTVTAEYLALVRAAGVNRLSFGMQSAHPDDLRLLERQHDFFDVAQAVRWARAAGIDNLSVDLIFGLPGQTLARWQETVETALGLAPDHLSLYALTIEHGTPLHRRWSHGLIPLVDDDLAAEMYEHAMDRLPRSGLEQYEISNWASRSPSGELLASRHNLQYWRGLPYLGFGAGAHGFAGGVRTANIGGVRPFIQRCAAAAGPDSPEIQFPAGPAARRVLPVDHMTQMQETMMVGLRLTQEGVSAAEFATRFDKPLDSVFGPQIERLCKLGLLEWAGGGDRLRLTRRGRLLGNQVFMQFV